LYLSFIKVENLSKVQSNPACFVGERLYNASFTDVILLKILKVGDTCPGPFDIIPDVQHDTGKKVKDERKTNCQKRRINKKQPDLGYRDMKSFAQVSANTERMSFKKG